MHPEKPENSEQESEEHREEQARGTDNEPINEIRQIYQ